MTEEEKVVETNEESLAVEEVTTTQEEENEVEFEDSNETETETETESKPVQSKEKNSEYARIRREQEQAKRIEQAKMEATIDALGGKNPYTNEEIKDEHDYKEYQQMREMAKKGYDPLADYSKYQKEQQRNALLQKQKEEENNLKARQDIDLFKEENPDVDLGSLLKDEGFKSLLRGEGNLQKAYQKYNDIVSKVTKNVESKYAQKIANNNASVGSTRNNYGDRVLDINSMTDEEFEEYHQKAIRGELKSY